MTLILSSFPEMLPEMDYKLQVLIRHVALLLGWDSYSVPYSSMEGV